MKKKSSKLQKLEKNRYSILTNDLEHCFICKMQPVDMHEIYGGSNRKVSMANGFCVPLCRTHHNMITIGKLNDLPLKKQCQARYEETHTRNDFMKLIMKNYLE